MSSNVPVYPGAIEPSPDPVLERARAKFPVSAEEVAAERALEQAQSAYDSFQRRVSKALVDIGAREGSTFGFGIQPDKFDAEGEELHQNLSRALVKLNRLQQERHAKIRREVDAENRKADELAQREWRKLRGIK